MFIQVLSCYKHLLKARKVTFKDDEDALKLVLKKIRAEFKKNKNETDLDKIKKVTSQATTSVNKINHIFEHSCLKKAGNQRK